MLKSVEGIYRGGKIELVEIPSNTQDETRVIVTFLAPNLEDLRAHGISRSQASELRARLSTFAEDWESPEMEIYDDYERAKTRV